MARIQSSIAEGYTNHRVKIEFTLEERDQLQALHNGTWVPTQGPNINTILLWAKHGPGPLLQTTGATGIEFTGDQAAKLMLALGNWGCELSFMEHPKLGIFVIVAKA